MDELEISGRRYISSARAAKEHKYHSDYIGQLVRGGKVAGQKVGRAWYVDADSLSEYLGKEVPARGPIARVIKPAPVTEPSKEKIPAPVIEEEMEESFERPVAEPVDVIGLSEDSPRSEFLMPLRKAGRQHVIEAIDSMPVTNVAKQIEQQPVLEVEEEIEELEAEEETFIPLKINKQPARDLYAEPEDSFYKVSRKGLRYVEQRTTTQSYEEGQPVIAPRAVQSKKSGVGGRVAGAIGLVLVAGILSLGAGVLMSYYLHSITTVEESGQTSSVILSN